MIDAKARRLIGVALATAVTWSAPAWASSEAGKFAVRGVGVETCAAFTKAFAERTQGAFVFAGWLDGYISAVNRLQPETFDAAPWQSTDILMVLINNHCAANPEVQLFGVVRALLDFYGGQRLTAASPRIDATAGETSVRLYREVLRQAQEGLAAAGVYSGTADGMYGPKTRAAFEAFQEQRGLIKSGLPDQQTLYHLFKRSPPAQ